MFTYNSCTVCDKKGACSVEDMACTHFSLSTKLILDAIRNGSLKFDGYTVTIRRD